MAVPSLREDPMLNIAIVAGSSRSNSQTSKVARFMRQSLINQHQLDADQVSVIDLGSYPLPLWPAEDVGPWGMFEKQLAHALLYRYADKDDCGTNQSSPSQVA